jgi:hypothetical protein
MKVRLMVPLMDGVGWKRRIKKKRVVRILV